MNEKMVSSSSDSIALPRIDPLSLVGQLPPAQVTQLWQKVTARILHYGFEIEFRALEPPKTGIFDGLRIAVDPAVDFETRCFVLIHLFGHSVQWVAPALESSLNALQHMEDHGRFIAALHDYEFAAAGFGLQLLHEAGFTELDQWFSDFVETDWRYVERFYLTGQIPSLRDCVAGGCRLVKPTRIPALRHRQVEVRFAF
jgi:hypothetical protein